MPDDAVLRISTVVDISGAHQLAAGTQEAMQKIIVAQQKVRDSAARVKDVYKELGLSAQQGSDAAAAAIQEEIASLAEAKLQLQQAVALYNRLARSKETATEATQRAISSRQAAAASLSVLEGRTENATRAASAFLSTTLGLGPVLQKAFPIIGAVALVDVLYQAGKAAYDLYENVVNLKSINDELDKMDLTLAEREKARFKEAQNAAVEYIRATKGTVAAQRQALSNLQSEQIDLSSFFNSKAVRDFPDSIKSGFEDAYKIIAPEDLPAKLKSLKAQIDSLKQSASQPHGISPTQAPLAGAFAAITPEQTENESAHTAARIHLAQKLYEELDSLRNLHDAKVKAEDGKLASDQVSQSAESAKQVLARQLASIEQWKASQHLAYEEGKSDAASWAVAQVFATHMAADANDNYYARAIGIYKDLGDAQKVNELTAQRAAASVKELAKETEDLASAIQKHNDLLSKMSLEWNKLQADAVGKNWQKSIEDQLALTKELAAAQEEASQKEIENKQHELESQRNTQEGAIKGYGAVSRGGLFDLGIQSQIRDQIKSLDERYTQQSIDLAKQAAAAKITELKKVEDADNKAARGDPASSQKYVTDAQEAANKIASIQQELENQITKIHQDGVDRRAQEDQKYQQKVAQVSNRIQQSMLQSENQALFQARSFGEAAQDVYKKIAETGIDSILKLANQWFTQHVIMAAVTRIVPEAAAATNTQQQAQTIATNVSLVTSYAGEAAAAAYAANAEFPPAAAAAAAAAQAVVLSFIPEASAAGGFDAAVQAPGMSSSGMITRIHPREMVLPSDVADNVRGFSGNNRSIPTTGGNTIHAHLHFSPTINSNNFDAKKHATDMFKELQGMLSRRGLNVK